MLRTSYTVALMFAILIAGTYWYSSVEAICRLPIYYTLGEVDERFGLSENEARTYISEAESVWEEATGRNLFTYSEDADLTINFIYDERQQSAEEAAGVKERLEVTQTVNEKLEETYSELVAKYKEQELIYQDRRASYEQRLNRYNAEVASYNEEGGAPPAEYERLEAEKKALDAEREVVNAMADELNDLSQQINNIGEQGNFLIEKYNENVRRFNDAFGHSEEFTQGDYQGREINIYTFQDAWELRLVLAHEFGHALALDHVENEESIMYYLLGEQPDRLTLTDQDLIEFEAICGDDVTVYDKFKDRLQAVFARLSGQSN